MRFTIAFVLLLAGGLSAVSCAHLAQARPPAFTPGEPAVLRYETERMDNVDLVINVWERTYPVPGVTSSEVGSNLDALRLAGTGHGPYSASTKWDIRTSLRYADEPTGCRIAGASIEVAALITLPALQDGSQMSAEMLARWHGYVEDLRVHELEHVQNEIAAGQNLQTALLAIGPRETCGAVGDAAGGLTEHHKAAVLDADLRLDEETKHGALTGATFP